MSAIPTSDKMLILGAGPLGLGVAKALGEQRIPYDQVDAADGVGGNWRHGVYETTHIISSRKTTEFPDWPMPDSYPDFPSGREMLAYYEAFAEAHGLYDALQPNTTVKHVHPRGDERWDVRLSTPQGEERRVYKGVFVCNGHHWDRRWPDSVQGFEGELIHSKDYKKPEQLRGKRVLVLGGGNSGCDLVSEAARVGCSADWSLRRGYWFLPKSMFGIPSVELIKGWAPLWMQRLFLRAMLRIVIGDYRRYGLPQPDHRIFETHPSVCTEIFHYLSHGRIQPRPDVAACNGREVEFLDGSRAEYDLIACATGFHLSFPFLPEGLVPVEGPVARLYGGALLPGYRHLYVFGTGQVRYGIGPVVRPYAQLMADWVKLQDEMLLPLGDVLRALGQRPPTTHLVDPHEAIRGMRRARKLTWLLRRKEKALRPREPRSMNAAMAG